MAINLKNPEVLEMVERGKDLPVLDLRPTKELLDELWGDAFTQTDVERFPFV
ncbi:MAG: hypothetical protein SFW67_20660 [Myxococcaceae bacterium]|nr:hypothetical protein [Myxococcaceae bacterium]